MAKQAAEIISLAAVIVVAMVAVAAVALPATCAKHVQKRAKKIKPTRFSQLKNGAKISTSTRNKVF